MDKVFVPVLGAFLCGLMINAQAATNTANF